MAHGGSKADNSSAPFQIQNFGSNELHDKSPNDGMEPRFPTML